MNTFGNIFRVSIFGESHGDAVGVLVDGCPPGLKITEAELLTDLDRRRSGAPGTTPRKEHDMPEIVSGLFNDRTTGAPLMVMTRNSNTRPSDYEGLKQRPRPGHADMVAGIKYKGFADPRGGGHFSGRLTWGLVVAGTIARKIINPAEVNAVITQVGGSNDIDNTIRKAVEEGDSVGGLIECRVLNLSPGLGEPFFLSAESAISQAVFSVPAVKGIEFGSGFRAASMKGSEHNDAIVDTLGKTLTNNAGGINGGITNGNELVFRVAVKPTSSISKVQKTIDMKSKKVADLVIEGRHDACIALRIPVIIESAAAIALADLLMMNRAINE